MSVRYELKIALTQPNAPVDFQTPGSSSHSGGVAITITTSPAKRILLDDDDDDIRRSARSCKGRRYQEFKEAVGRKGRRSHRSGDSRSEIVQYLGVRTEKNTRCGICYSQCDQIGLFISLWVTFQSQWQQLFCPNRPCFRQFL